MAENQQKNDRELQMEGGALTPGMRLAIKGYGLPSAGIFQITPSMLDKLQARIEGIQLDDDGCPVAAESSFVTDEKVAEKPEPEKKPERRPQPGGNTPGGGVG